MTDHQTTEAIPSPLYRMLAAIAMTGLSVLISFALWLAAVFDQRPATYWLLPAVLCWFYVIHQTWQRLPLNRPVNSHRPLERFGVATSITLTRGLLIAMTAGFIGSSVQLQPSAWVYLPAIFYTVAAIGDALDGYIARRLNQVTELGSELDTVLDALGLLIAPVLAVLLGKLHPSYLVVSVAYYLFRWGIYWRQTHQKPVFSLQPSYWRRRLAGWQMALVATALWPPVPALLAQLAGFVLMLPLLVGFWRDWLVVSGRRT